MAFTRESTGTQGTAGWGVFVAKSSGEWKLPLFREDDGTVGIKANGRDILRSIPIRLPEDANCCPTGGADIARFRYVDGEFLKVSDSSRPASVPAGFYKWPADEKPTEAQFEDCGPLSGPLANNFFDIQAMNIDCSEARDIVERQARGRDLAGFTCRFKDTGHEAAQASAHATARPFATRSAPERGTG